MLIDITWGWGVSGGPVSWTWPSHLEGSGPTPSQSTKTLPAIWLRRKVRKNKNKKTDRTLGQMAKAILYRQNHTKKHTHTHSQKEEKEKYIHIRILKKKKRPTKSINKSTKGNKL